MKLYKLTNTNGYSGPKDSRLSWGENVTHTIPTEFRQPVLCTHGVIHAYRCIEHALLFNDIHADYIPFLLWEAEGEVVVDAGDKVGCYELTTLSTVEIPRWYWSITEVVNNIRRMLINQLPIAPSGVSVVLDISRMLGSSNKKIRETANAIIVAAIKEVSE